MGRAEDYRRYNATDGGKARRARYLAAHGRERIRATQARSRARMRELRLADPALLAAFRAMKARYEMRRQGRLQGGMYAGLPDAIWKLRPVAQGKAPEKFHPLPW